MTLQEFTEQYKKIVVMNRSICNHRFYGIYSFKNDLSSNIDFISNFPTMGSMIGVLSHLRDTFLNYERAVLSGESSRWWYSENKDDERQSLEESFHLRLSDIYTDYMKYNHDMLNVLEMEFSNRMLNSDLDLLK